MILTSSKHSLKAVNFNSESSIRYFIERSGTSDASGIDDPESNGCSGGSGAAGKVPAGSGDANRFSLVDGETDDRLDVGDGVTVTVYVTLWFG